MALSGLKKLSDLSNRDYRLWVDQALRSGELPANSPVKVKEDLYRRQQLRALGLNENLQETEPGYLNAAIKFNDLNRLNQSKQLGTEVQPLIDLYKDNPQLAAKLTDELFDSGYLTSDQISKRSESSLNERGGNKSTYEGGQGWNTFYKGVHDFLGKIPLAGGINDAILGGVDKLDKDKKSLEDYDSKAFKYYYDQVKKEREGSRIKEGDIYKEARRRYLFDQNSNIFRDIQTQIDNYYQGEVETRAPQIERTLNQMSPKDIITQIYGESAASKIGQLDEKGRPIDAFDVFAQGTLETVPTAYGDATINHPGSNWWRGYKDTSVFDNFSDSDKNQIMSRYLAYRELLGEDKANEYLETAMQTYVAQHRGWSKAIVDVAGGIGTTAGLIIPEALIGVGGLAYDVIGTILPDDYGGAWAKNQASIMLTGRDLQGNAIDVPNLNEVSDPLSWLGSRLNMSYLNKVSQYKNWDIDQIRKAEANGGVSKDAMYVIDPTKGRQFKHDFLEMLDMGGQIIGQVALAYLTSGASLDARAAQTMGKTAAASRVGAEIATTTAPISATYAVGAANEAFNNTINTARDIAYRQAQEQLTSESQTEEYKKKKHSAVDKFFSTHLSYPDTPESRKQQEEIYDRQYLENIANNIISERESETNQIAQNSSLLAYRASASIEALKYGYTTAMFGSWKLSNNANKLLEQNLGVKTYGELTQNAAGRFTREGIHPLGIKKLTLKSPNQIATWRIAESAIVGGGISNYTDDVTTGFAVGLSLGYSNSSLLREYDPQAYADTWYGNSEAAQALYILGSGVQGANDMIRSGQPWHSFYIGVGGSFLGAGFRFRGRKDIRKQYAEQNAWYEAETGKKVSKQTKFWQRVNTYTQTLWSTYQDARLGVNRLDQNIKVYNQTLDKRQDVLNQIASVRQGIIKRKYADNEMSFSDATLESDNLALKLISIGHSLESNPLRQLDKQRFDHDLSELYDIAEDNVSNEKRESLIQSAYGVSEQDKSKPLTDQRKAEIWEDIKANARRFAQFSSDYYEAVDQLKSQYKYLKDPDNWPLLHQKAELIAKTKRIQRDIYNLSKEIGINVDTQVTDRTQGELTEVARQSSIKATQETIDQLRKQRQEAQEKIDELTKKETLTKEESEQLSSYQASIMGADRFIPRLEAEIESLKEGTTIARANSGLTTNVIQLHNMLSYPELYTTEQQGQINIYRAQIGQKGVLYIEEIAKMQDQLNEIKDAQEALEAHPETFWALVTGLQGIRKDMGQKAIYNTRLQTQFNVLRRLPHDKIGAHSAIALTDEQFNQFIKENPEFSGLLSPYKGINTAFSHIYSLTQAARKNNTLDESTQKYILRSLQSLSIQDSDYLLKNGSQGLADMIQFLITANTGNSVIHDALSTLLQDFKNVAAVENSTIAYTEYKLRQRYKEEGLTDEIVDAMINSIKEEEARQAKEAQEKEIQRQQQQEESKKEEQEKPREETKEELIQQTEDKQIEEQAQPQEEITPIESTDKLPSGVTRSIDRQIETMTAEQQVEQLGIKPVQTDSMVDDNAPIIQESTEQQEEVHGTYFNPYDSNRLKAGELVPYTDGSIYSWLQEEGINLGDIIDNELHQILQVNPKVQLMKVKSSNKDANVASNIFLVVEYTDMVAKHHLHSNGGVINSNGKQYLIVGTMWNTKAQNNTEAANLMIETRNTLQSRGSDFFTNNPTERFYVDPIMETRVTTFNSGHIINTVDGESVPHTLTELIDQYNSIHTEADQISISDLGFGVITMKEGLYPIGPHSKGTIHAPQKLTPDKYGQIYVLVPAANGEIIPIFINPTVYSELRDSAIKTRIESDIIPRLVNSDYSVREQAISDLCQLLCISGNISNPDGKTILIGTEKISTVTFMNGKVTVGTFDISKQNFNHEDVRNALRALNPRINLNLSSLDTQTNANVVLRYDEAGVLTTDAVKLGTFGSKFYVSPINPSTGKPIIVREKPSTTVETTSDYSKAQQPPVMLFIEGNQVVFRDGKWVNTNGSAITDTDTLQQIEYVSKIQNGEAVLSKRQDGYNYYIIGIETSKPIVILSNPNTGRYEEVSINVANQIIAERRAEIEMERADAVAEEFFIESNIPLEIQERESTDNTTREDEKVTDKQVQSTKEQLQEAPKKNDFALDNIDTKEKYSIDDIISREDMMDQADQVYDIIRAKMNSDNASTRERWQDFNMENIAEELEKRGVNTTDISDVESWIDNLKNCKN